MLIPTFRFQLNNAVVTGLVTVGKFDGKHPSLACATSPDNILIHSPHHRNESNEHEIRQLSVRRQISALSCGDLEAKEKARDILLVGTHTNLLAYAVEANKDIFYKEVRDGVNALVFGTIPSIPSPLVVVGGNCSIEGFDAEGDDLFWTVTGDNVSALALRDPSGEGKNELVVGSEDYEIRIFEKEEVICEVTEADVVSGLTFIRQNLYGYSLANGTIGVYNNDTRVWHAKSKHAVQAISAFDLDSDGVPEFIAGWSNGRVEVRNDQVGELVYKDRFDSPIAQIVIADYRMDGRDEIIACSTDGEIRGYLPAEEDMQGNLMEVSASENAIQNLYTRKQELLAELKGYESNTRQMRKGLESGQSFAGAVPADTQVALDIKPGRSEEGLVLTLSTNNDVVIKMAIILSEYIFEGGESKVVRPAKPGTSLRVVIKPTRNVEAEVLVKAVVGYPSSAQDHVFEELRSLSKYNTFMLSQHQTINTPTDYVTFTTSERANRLVLWMQKSFNLDDQGVKTVSVSGEYVRGTFVNVVTGEPLSISMKSEKSGANSITINTPNMELAGDLVQDICKYLGIEELSSVADFPSELEKFSGILKQVEEANSTRLKLSAEIADSSNYVKTLVIRAEDARILNDIPFMNNMYSQLHDTNMELMGEYTKRANNHSALMRALPEVNHMIQKAARLRMGSSKTKVVGACRKAIKTENINSLHAIIKTGAPAS